jgi:signal transduction histidine kinase
MLNFKKSIKTSIAFAVSILFVVAAAVIATIVINYFQEEFKNNISSYQTTVASTLTDELDDKFRRNIKALQAVSSIINTSVVSNPEASSSFLNNRHTLKALFDNGIGLFSMDGKIIADTIYGVKRSGQNISHREYFKSTIETGRPHISEPFISSQPHKKPSIMITVPVFDADGGMIAILGGSFDLTGDNIIGRLSDIKIGKTGYVWLSTMDRTLIAHGDKSRIMTKVPEGRNETLEKALKGFEGTEDGFTSKGVSALMTVKRLKTVDWVLGITFPAKEAYTPVKKARLIVYFMVAVGMFVWVLCLWYFAGIFTRPILSLTEQVKDISAGSRKEVNIRSDNEIGTLASAFNELLVQRRLIEEDLNESKRKLGDINDMLEMRINEEVNKSRVKDKVMFEQARHLAMGELLINIAHQWRQPLAALAGITQNIRDAYENGELDRETMNSQVERAMKELKGLSKTIKDFGSFYRIEEALHSFDIAEEVQKCLAFIERDMKENHISVETELQRGIMVTGYAGDFSRAVLNILLNARDAIINTKKTDGKVRITLSAKPSGGAVLSILDNGGGIADNIRDKLFDPYFTTKEKERGTGLGLYMSKLIIETAMKGTLTAKNSNGGAEFIIEV